MGRFGVAARLRRRNSRLRGAGVGPFNPEAPLKIAPPVPPPVDVAPLVALAAALAVIIVSMLAGVTVLG